MTAPRTHEPREARIPQPASRAAAPASRAARALTLQRLAGNRAAGRILARWVRHPDPEKKAVMVPDVVAEDYARFNPPQNG